jgi:hypothetical protein
MRFDTFVDKKSVHFKLDKDVHLALRAMLFKYNLSMQDLFDEFALLVVQDSPKARSIIELILNKKMKYSLRGEKAPKRKQKENFNEIDTETLYNMINDSDDQ